MLFVDVPSEELDGFCNASLNHVVKIYPPAATSSRRGPTEWSCLFLVVRLSKFRLRRLYRMSIAYLPRVED